MNSETLAIIDNAIRFSLLAFVCFFAFFQIYAALRLRRRTRRLADYFQEEFENHLREEALEEAVEEKEDPVVLTSNRLRTAFHSLALAAFLAALCFLLFSFAPLPFFHNFATDLAWQTTPLRLTALSFERFHEGFSLDGEVWNQTQEPIAQLQVVVTIWDHNREPLDEVAVSVSPQPLDAGKAGRFEMRYEKNSPFLYGYQVAFRDGEGSIVPHLEGFNVR